MRWETQGKIKSKRKCNLKNKNEPKTNKRVNTMNNSLTEKEVKWTQILKRKKTKKQRIIFKKTNIKDR